MLLVTGCRGQLGTELQTLLGDRAEYADQDKLDIADEQAVKAYFASHDVDCVINCAAYTNVDQAEDSPEAADRVNRLGAELLSRYGRRIIHISTDYVFDGTGHVPYREEDPVNPVSVYGRTKLDGERAVLRYAETALIVRTAWLYSHVGRNFVKTMRRLGSERDAVGVVADQIGTPTYAADLASVITKLLPGMQSGSKEIYHYTNEGVCSWYDFAVAVMELSGYSCKVLPLTTSEYPSRAQRPAYGVLSKMKIRRDFGINIPHWRDGLKRCLRKLEQ
ncbi:MAG: dTDP-4-dehydrorhamnose reductase [Desulfovibrionaceae bacterium]|nr:dTDP-4-dehydrorhamnose reductase [Desulfovibrionaceae bacterium]